MAVIIPVPAYVNHAAPIVLGEDTTADELLAYIDAAAVDPAHEVVEDYDVIAQRLNEYKSELSFYYLSQAYNVSGRFKGQIISRLKVSILEFTSLSADNAAFASRLTNRSDFKEDSNLTQIIERVNYISKNFFKRYWYNLKQEKKGITPALFFSGVGMLISGFFTLSRADLIEDERVALEQKSTAWTQIGIGATFTASPFANALFKTVSD